MQWNGDEGCGFTSGTPWLKVNPNYKEVNVKSDLSDPDGVIAFFKQINSFKKSSETMREGGFRLICADGKVYSFARETDDETLIAVCNFTTRQRPVPVGVDGDILISNYRDPSDKLRPYEFRLYRR